MPSGQVSPFCSCKTGPLPSKAATDKLCEQYGLKDAERCTSYGVSEFNPDLCNLREVNKPSNDTYEYIPPAEQEAEPTTSSACLYDPENPEPCNDTPQSDEPTPLEETQE